MATQNAVDTSFPIGVNVGGTGVSSFTANSVICSGSTTTSPLISQAASSGQLMVGQSSGPPVFSNTCTTNGFFFEDTTSGSTLTLNLQHTSNTAGSGSQLNISVGGDSAGDAYCQCVIASATTWSFGIDNSDSNAYVLAANASLGATNVMRCDTTGVITWPLQTAFLLNLGSSQLNKTGTGTTYTIGTGATLTKVFDQNTDITTSGVLTAPVTGKYRIEFGCSMTGMTIAVSQIVSIVTSNRTYRRTFFFATGSASSSCNIEALCDMDAADTSTFTVACTGEAGDTDDVSGAASPLVTYISGNLEC